MKITIERAPEVVLTIESDGEGRWTISGDRLARQDDGVTQYTTDDGLHVLGLLQLYVGSADSLEFLKRKLHEHDEEAKA